MSESDKDIAPISPESPLGKALGSYDVPELSSGFADRIVAATEGRKATLPPLRRSGSRWRSARRAAVGVLAAGALGTAAAATGALDDLPIKLPTPAEVWTSLTGQSSAPPPTTPVEQPDADFVPDEDFPVVIEGPIDTPEELEEAFRRIDNVRGNRREMRRGRVDQRIDEAIEYRREQGLPAPDAAQEERLKTRLQEFRERQDDRREEFLEDRRETLRERIESGEALGPGDVIREERGLEGETPIRDRLRELRQLPPEERRERIRQFRERRQERREATMGAGALEPDALDAQEAPATQEAPETQETDAPIELAEPETPPEE